MCNDAATPGRHHSPTNATAANSGRVRYIFLLFTLLGCAFCILVPWCVNGTDSQQGFFHFAIFQRAWYQNVARNICIYHDHISFTGSEIWDVWAIMQSFLTTFLLQLTAKAAFEAQASVLSGFVSALALVFLGLHHVAPFGFDHRLVYGGLLIVAVVGYTLSDFSMWLHGRMEEREFVEVIYFVDVPVLLGLAIFFFYIGHTVGAAGSPPPTADNPFISGAIAFQLILGNIILILIRSRITEHTLCFDRIKCWCNSSGKLQALSTYLRAAVNKIRKGS